MTKTLTLRIKDRETKAVTPTQFDIEEMDGYQFEETVEIISEIYESVQNDARTKDLVDGLFSGTLVPDEDQEVNMEFILKILDGFKVLLVTLPSQAFRLLSALSDIPLDVVKSQKLSKHLEIYDAIIEENDIVSLMERGKQSLNLTKEKFPKKQVEKE